MVIKHIQQPKAIKCILYIKVIKHILFMVIIPINYKHIKLVLNKLIKQINFKQHIKVYN